MIKKEELRLNNLVTFEKRIFKIHSLADIFPTLDTIEFGIGIIDYNNIEPISITKEILKNNLSFDVTDMGDFWQAQKEDFVIVQIKFNLGNVQMPWVFMINSSIKGSVKFDHVHHLQNTFFDLKGKELKWKNFKNRPIKRSC